jgi:Na+-transporting NADH:ubiquinone oxidoreductase subunit NqrB
MPEGGAGALRDALLAMAARRVRLLTVVVLVGAIILIAAQDASWTTIAVAGIALLAVATGWLSVALWLRVFRTSGGRRES